MASNPPTHLSAINTLWLPGHLQPIKKCNYKQADQFTNETSVNPILVKTNESVADTNSDW